MDAITPVMVQAAFRGRDDFDGTPTLNSTSWALGAGTSTANVSWTQDTDSPFRVRLLVQETAGGDWGPGTFTWQFRVNTGSWTTVGATTACKLSYTTSYTHGADTEQLLGSGTFVTGDGMTSSATTGNISNLNNEETEFEICLEIDSTLVSQDDTVEIRLNDDFNTAELDTYTNTPSLTVNIPAVATAHITALDLDITYDPSEARVSALDLDITYDPTEARITALDLDITYDPSEARVSALDLDISYTQATTSSPLAFNGTITAQWDEATGSPHHTGIEVIASANDNTYIRTVTPDDIDEFEVTDEGGIDTLKHVEVEMRGVITDAGDSAVIAVSLWSGGIQRGTTQYITTTDFGGSGTRGNKVLFWSDLDLTAAQANALQVRFQALASQP